jgi:hypothetical protein
LLEKALNSLENLNSLFDAGDFEKKRKVIGSIFSEKIVFDGSMWDNQFIAIGKLSCTRLFLTRIAFQRLSWLIKGDRASRTCPLYLCAFEYLRKGTGDKYHDLI